MRLRLRQLQPGPYAALDAWHVSVANACADAGLDRRLIDLVWLRVSQINGCSFCVDMHHREALAHGERRQRLDLLGVWREAGDLFTPLERAVLGFAEAMTLLDRRDLPDLREILTPEQLSALIMSVSVINAYNRVGVASGARVTTARSHVPAQPEMSGPTAS